jgi:hypothetical protein
MKRFLIVAAAATLCAGAGIALACSRPQSRKELVKASQVAARFAGEYGLKGKDASLKGYQVAQTWFAQQSQHLQPRRDEAKLWVFETLKALPTFKKDAVLSR